MSILSFLHSPGQERAAGHWAAFRRWSSLALVALLSTGMLTACQADMGAEQRLLAAARRMEQVQTAHFTSQGTLTVREAREDGFRGETNFALDGDAVFPDRQRATVVISDGQRVETEFIRIGQEVWVQNPQTGQWVRGTVEQLQIQPMDPVQVVALVTTAAQRIEDLGEAQLGQERVRHLRVVLDPQRTQFLIAQTNPELGDRIRSVSGTVDLWIGEDNLIRQVQPDITVQVTNIGADQGQPTEGELHTNFTMFLTDFDQPVQIEPPATAQQVPQGQQDRQQQDQQDWQDQQRQQDQEGQPGGMTPSQAPEDATGTPMPGTPTP